METTNLGLRVKGLGLGLYWDNGQYNGNYGDYGGCVVLI